MAVLLLSVGSTFAWINPCGYLLLDCHPVLLSNVGGRERGRQEGGREVSSSEYISAKICFDKLRPPKIL